MFYDGNEHLCILTWGARGTRCICGKIYPTLWMLHIILNVMCTVYNYICRKLQDISSNESNPISVQKMLVPWYWYVVLSVAGHGTVPLVLYLSKWYCKVSLVSVWLVGGARRSSSLLKRSSWDTLFTTAWFPTGLLTFCRVLSRESDGNVSSFSDRTPR